jgi:hypothetical protein
MFIKARSEYFISQKNDMKLFCRSQLEMKACEKLEADTNVLKYIMEPMKCVPYIKDGDTKCYIPDILVFYKNGEEKLIEVKPHRLVNSGDNPIKIKALKEYSKKHAFSCDIWTERNMRN